MKKLVPLDEAGIVTIDKLLSAIADGRYEGLPNARDVFSEDLWMVVPHLYAKPIHDKLFALSWDWSEDWKPNFRVAAKKYDAMSKIVDEAILIDDEDLKFWKRG